MRFWLGVASREHVELGVQLGIAQIGHGKRSGLARMQRGDGVVYYAPRLSVSTGTPVRAFAAIGLISDDEIWQADAGPFQPWRRRVDYDASAREVHLDAVKDRLSLTSTASWGYQLRRGLLELTPEDFTIIRAAMTTP